MLSLCPLSHAEVKVPPKRYSLSKQLLWFPVPLGTWVERSPGMSYFPQLLPQTVMGELPYLFRCKSLVILASELVLEYSSVGEGQVWSPLKSPALANYLS